MKKTQYGLSEAGFVIKPLSVILEEEKEAFKQSFGDDVDLSGESVAGAYVGNQAAKIAELWAQLEGLWNAGDVDSAGGVFLDRLVAFVNVQREGAKKTQVVACLWGDEGTQVVKGTLAKLSSTNDVFELTQAVEISRKNALGVEIAVTQAASFSLVIGNESIVIDCEEGDTEETLLEKLAAEIEVRCEDVKSEKTREKMLLIVSKDGVSAFSFEITGALEIKAVGSPAFFACQEAGRIYAPSGTLTKMVSNVQGVSSIINYATGTTGRDAESDTELRLNLGTRQKQATCTEGAIENALAKLDGVTYARVHSNRGISEAAGRPPKSFEAVVEGGDEQTIAETIFAHGPCGIQAFGNTTRTVKDSQGFDWQIGFSRPVKKNIWIHIILSLYAEEEFPTGAVQAIKSNIIEWAGKNLGVGVDLIFQRLNIPIYKVPGIASAEIKVATTLDASTPPEESDYKAENIEIGEVEIAVIDESRISISVE